MSKVKSFTAYSLLSLEAEINEWAVKTDASIISVSHCFHADTKTYSAVIVYDKTFR